mmetsp:Transcript_17248/g.19615  ORF Transcript_17248/g.19615 Transcript_17248/m.19615 type:complete len:156 (+) Transcript_17248:176-643(+)
MGGIEVMLLVSRQGKIRLTKFYEPIGKKEKQRLLREVSQLVISRPQKLCNFVEWKGRKVVYKRYASLYFITIIAPDENELITLETIHHFVEVLDKYFGNVCELDIIFNFHKAYYILDEIFLGGEIEETSKREVLRVAAAQDELMQEEKERDNIFR